MLYKLRKTLMPLHRIVIESYEKSFRLTITNQRETLRSIHQSWYQ